MFTDLRSKAVAIFRFLVRPLREMLQKPRIQKSINPMPAIMEDYEMIKRFFMGKLINFNILEKLQGVIKEARNIRQPFKCLSNLMTDNIL